MQLQRCPDLLWERLGDSVALLDKEHATAHSLDGAAAAVWLRCTTRCAKDELTDGVAAQGFARSEIDESIDSLLALGLLTVPGGLDRRELLRTGVGAAALGAVLSIALPEPAAALSTGGPAPAFLNTTGFDVNGMLSTPPNEPVIASLDSATTLDFLSSSALVRVTSNPTVGSIDWIADPDGGGTYTFPQLDLTFWIPVTFDVGSEAYNAFMAATSLRIDFYDDTPTYTGTAYFPDPA